MNKLNDYLKTIILALGLVWGISFPHIQYFVWLENNSFFDIKMLFILFMNILFYIAFFIMVMETEQKKKVVGE